jgi:four helix bundle protein
MTRTAMPPIGEWEKGADAARVGDPLWTVQAYRISLYAIECHNFDRRLNSQLVKAPSFDQLTRAVGSISANIAEGYSRSSIADRTRFYGYALGSTREAIAWYDTLTIELGDVAGARQDTLIQIRRLLLTMLRRTRPEGPVLSMRDAPRRAREAGE